MGKEPIQLLVWHFASLKEGKRKKKGRKGKRNFLLIRTKICVLNRLLRNVSLAYLMLTTHADKTLKEILSSIVEHVPIFVRRQPDG